MHTHRTATRTAGRRATVAVALVVALGLFTGCTKGDDGGSADNNNGGGSGGKSDGPVATVTEPKQGATDVPASTEIRFSTDRATGATVELKDESGEAVTGTLQKDGSWLPDGALKYGTKYTATVTATGDGGETGNTTSTFTTMPKPANQVRVSSFLGDNQVVGVGMPLIVEFGRAIPEDARADVQRRLIVKTDPPQEGAWRWTKPTEVQFRPKTYWRANTKLSYKMQVGGLPMGDGWYGRSDITVDARTGSALIMTVDNATKKMIVTKDGKVIRTIPVSLGKPKTPSSSGNMVVIEKARTTVFDTFADLGPREGYRINIEYAQRLTWGGEYIHSAPWSVASQGRRNVSHGCLNMSPANASWLFSQTRIGDPVIVKGTERKLQNGNGWTAWNMSWEEWIKGSAIPYEEPSASPSATPEPTPSA